MWKWVYIRNKIFCRAEEIPTNFVGIKLSSYQAVYIFYACSYYAPLSPSDLIRLEKLQNLSKT